MTCSELLAPFQLTIGDISPLTSYSSKEQIEDSGGCKRLCCAQPITFTVACSPPQAKAQCIYLETGSNLSHCCSACPTGLKTI